MAENKEFLIENIFVNKCTFEAPTPIFRLNKDWKPSANLDLDVQNKSIGDDKWEIDLLIKVAVAIDKENVFNVTVVQSGTFLMKGYNETEVDQLLNSFCPAVLYPYARQVVANLVSQAAFPPLHLSPVDFEGRYQMIKKEEASSKK